MKTNFRFPSGTGCSGRLLHGALHTLAAALLLFAGSACENEDPDVYTPPAPEPLAPLTLVPNMDPRVQNDIEIEEETTGVYRIHTTGEDPYFCTVPFDGNVPADLNVLAFEYQTDRRTDHIQLFFWTEVDGEVIPDVERTIVTTPFEAADTWKEYSVRIRKCREEFFWGEAGNLLRIDFGTVKDADIRLRNLRLREMTDAERAEDAAENENDQNASVYEERLKEYLHASYTSKVDRVEATADKIRITAAMRAKGASCSTNCRPTPTSPASRPPTRNTPHRSRRVRSTSRSTAWPRPKDFPTTGCCRNGRRMLHGRGRPHRLARPLRRRGRRAA